MSFRLASHNQASWNTSFRFCAFIATLNQMPKASFIPARGKAKRRPGSVGREIPSSAEGAIPRFQVVVRGHCQLLDSAKTTGVFDGSPQARSGFTRGSTRSALLRRTASKLISALFLAGLVTTRAQTTAVPAPELKGDAWLNVPQGRKITLASRKGKVTVVHFWTFGCINCKRNLPYYDQWRKQFAASGLEIIGIHTPETDEERDAANVSRNVKELGITYPVLIDQNSENWKAWQQRCWPTVYLVDKLGRVRFAWEGELEYQGAGGYAKVTQMIQGLLKERGT